MEKGYLKKRMEESVDRRKCLKLMGMLGLGVAAPALVAGRSEAGLSGNLHQASKTRPLMGTLANITILDASRDKAEEATEKAFERMTEAIGIFDRHTAGTPITSLNQEGVLRDVSPEMAAVLHQSAYFHGVTGGAFDITILPLLELYRKSFAKSDASPTAQQVNEKMALVDSNMVHLDQKGVRLKKDGMQISLDGIAKGYVVDQAANVIQALGVKYALVNAGGDIRAMGGNGPEKAWQIGITDPWGRKKYVELVSLNNGALATSGNYEHFFDKERLHHHIIDASKGRSPRETVSATVLAPTVMEADALSTALFILEPHDSINLVRSLPNAEAMLIARGGRTFRSPGWSTQA
jgi:thiamine biosynthesis lipoprotein